MKHQESGAYATNSILQILFSLIKQFLFLGLILPNLGLYK
jgi:hypothetical protein